MDDLLVLSTARSDLGQLKALIRELHRTPGMSCGLLAVGDVSPSLLNSELGDETMRELSTSNLISVPRTAATPELFVQLGEALPAIVRHLDGLRPQGMVVLGDRLEALMASICAVACGIPIVHLHGGEETRGSLDDRYRHAITKLASVHFVANDLFRSRVIQMGEDPESVYVVGALAHELAASHEGMNSVELASRVGAEVDSKTIMVTMHPVTSLATGESLIELNELMRALDHFTENTIVWTEPNADPGSDAMWREIQAYCKSRASSHAVLTLGHDLYVSTMKMAGVVVGNSSSGLTEAPALGVPSVDVGRRQEGRPRADTVRHCDAREQDIVDAIRLSLMTRSGGPPSADVDLPYGKLVNTARLIAEVLVSIDPDALSQKNFFPLDAGIGHPFTSDRARDGGAA